MHYERPNAVREDQAETLRRAGRGRKRPRRRGVTRVLSFTSGKGGVGKTHTVVNLAVSLADMGKSVLILDADFGLANVDIMLGVAPTYTLRDFFESHRTLDEIIMTGPGGISLLPASSGVEWMSSLDVFQRMALFEAVEASAHRFDYLLIDTQAGIGSNVLQLNIASSEIVCVVTPEPTSITDAYALIKILATRYGEKEVSVLVSNVAAQGSDSEARRTFRTLAQVVERFLHTQVKYLGYVPTEPLVGEAVREQRPLVRLHPSCGGALALSRLASRIDADFMDLKVKGGMQFFFQDLLDSGRR